MHAWKAGYQDTLSDAWENAWSPWTSGDLARQVSTLNPKEGKERVRSLHLNAQSCVCLERLVLSLCGQDVINSSSRRFTCLCLRVKRAPILPLHQPSLQDPALCWLTNILPQCRRRYSARLRSLFPAQPYETSWLQMCRTPRLLITVHQDQKIAGLSVRVGSKFPT